MALETSPVSPLPLRPRRTADWYELFFDLVFVVVVAVAVTLIEVDPSIDTVLVFILLLFPLWWAWVNLMVTNNLFGARFAVIGALVVASMPGPAAMAVAIAGGIDHLAWLYAAGAAWIRLVLLIMWLIPRKKAASSISPWRTVAYNLVTAAIWLVSILVPAPWNYVMWAVAVAGEMALLALRSRFSSEIYDRASISHSLERIGLFIVIVIGEAVYLAVTGIAAHPTVEGGAAALFGFVVCALLARTFFRWGIPTAEAGLESAQLDKSYGALRDVVMYLPFLLVVGLTFVAASIGISVERAGEPLPLAVRLLLAAGIGILYLTNALIGVRLKRRVSRILTLLVPGLVLPAIASLGSGGLAAWVTVLLVAIALLLLDLMSLWLGRIASTPPPQRE
ncbi:MAG: low temperature requirement protein A [Cryobacterium sp.]|nr:low temperature requirement protein A [Cryobacterium sp.]